MIKTPFWLAGVMAVCLSFHVSAREKPNVLFVSVDDLRPALGCYGDPQAKTPNLDRLAGSAVVFERAYCQLPSCCPSRTSVLTGLRPDTTGVTSNGSPHFRKLVPDVVTLPQHFKSHGYFCKELGKVFHRRDPISWSEPKWVPSAEIAYPIYQTEENLKQQRSAKVTRKPNDWWGAERWIKVSSWEAPEVEDEVLFDGQLAVQAIKELNRQHTRPFFLALGFFRPHLPFIAPQKYYDLYPPGTLTLPENLQPPAQAPEAAIHRSNEPRSYMDVPRSGEFSKARQLEWLRGYYASVSYVDAQIGRVLDGLDRLRLRENTVIVIWSDHGYHFGEQKMWGKLTNFENAARSTLIVSAPGLEAAKTRALVELVDLYPTLCELCDLAIPENLEGESFAPLLRDPNAYGKTAAFTQANPNRAMGYSMRTDRYRYTEWRRDERVVATELYDHETDPDETRNLAPKADPALLNQLKSRL